MGCFVRLGVKMSTPVDAEPIVVRRAGVSGEPERFGGEGGLGSGGVGGLRRGGAGEQGSRGGSWVWGGGSDGDDRDRRGGGGLAGGEEKEGCNY